MDGLLRIPETEFLKINVAKSILKSKISIRENFILQKTLLKAVYDWLLKHLTAAFVLHLVSDCSWFKNKNKNPEIRH